MLSCLFLFFLVTHRFVGLCVPVSEPEPECTEQQTGDRGQGRPGGHMHSGGPAERRVRQRRAASLISYHHNMPTLYQ